MTQFNHQNNFQTKPSSAISAGATTSPLNDIPTCAAPFKIVFDADNANSHYEVVTVTSKTATNINHAALTYAHGTSELVRLDVTADEMDALNAEATNSTNALANVRLDSGIMSSYIQRQGIINGGMEVSQENGVATVALVNNTAKYACDLISVTPSGTAVSAGTQAQIANSTIGTSGYALKLAGVTITGTGTIKRRYRMEAADAVKFKNKVASFSMQELQDTGGSLNYTIQINKANSADNFSAVTQIAISGNLAVPSGAGTRIVLENVSMGDCSNGIEIVQTIPCGAITTKNFETTEWQMNVGAVALPFVCGSRAEELAKVMRYFQSLDTAQTDGIPFIAYGSTSYAVGSYLLRVIMRTTPTFIFGNGGVAARVRQFPSGAFITSITMVGGNNTGLFVIGSSAAFISGAVYTVSYLTADARFTA